MRKIVFKQIKTLCLAIMLLFSNTFYCVNVIFDLGEVLIATKKTYLIQQVGVYSFLMFLLRLNNPFSLRSRLFSALHRVPAISQNEFGTGDGNGNALPNIMCDWLAGTQSNEEILKQINDFFQNNPDIFYNSAEKNIINKITSMMFNPKRLSKSRRIIKDGIKFVKTCKEQGHEIFILSNWDKESFAFALEAFPDLFSLFKKENITISGEIGIIKPDPLIYEYILAKNNLKPEECIFFDDQEVNIKAAKEFGIHGIVCKNIRYKKMVEELGAFVANI